MFEMLFQKRISNCLIRKRSKLCGWIRDVEGAKRSMVKERMAGIGATERATERASAILQAEADVDAMVLKSSSAVFSRIIERCGALLDGASEAREVKVISEANRLAVEGYMKVRGLNDKEQKDDDSFETYLAKIGARKEGAA